MQSRQALFSPSSPGATLGLFPPCHSDSGLSPLHHLLLPPCAKPHHSPAGVASSGEPLVGHWSPVNMHEDSRLHLLCSFFLQATRASRPIPWVLDKYQLQFIKTVPIATAREPLPCTRLGAPHCADIISLCPAALPPAIFSSFVETLRRWWGKVMPKVTGLPVGARTSGQRNFKAGHVLSCEVHSL